MKPIYLDYMSTTPVDVRVAERMLSYMTLNGEFGNASSRTHIYGKHAAVAVEQARQQVADLLHCQAEAIFFTSGATESINLALLGAARFYQQQGRHIITYRTEHTAVLDTCAQLQREGFEVTYLTPERNGLIDVQQLKNALRADTLLVSILHANNEIGVIQDIAAIAQLTRSRGVLLHVDAAQSVGKITIDLSQLEVDLLSMTAHKLYGPKGVGALYIRQHPRLRLQSLLHGGGQERGLRPGTLPVQQIVGLGEACAIAQQEMPVEAEHLLMLRQRLWSKLQVLGNVHVHGDLEQRLPGNLNVSFAGIDGKNLLQSLPGLAVSSGSACTSGNLQPSHVLLALGVNEALARSAVRFSLGRFTTQQDIDDAVTQISVAVNRLRG